MTRLSSSRRSLVPALALGALVAQPLGAQSDGQAARGRHDVVWENDRMSVAQVSVDPGATVPAAGDRILIHFSADADGRMPAEAVWQPANAPSVENRGPRRLEALAIALKEAPQGETRATPPEALASDGVAVTTLIDNPRVLVMKHRYDPMISDARVHFHTQGVLVVYLRGGYTWPLDGSWGAARVRQADIDLVPANTFHRLANAGADPLELLVVIPR